MLTHISLENFKSWRRITNMRLAPITALFGTNSSGKTSLLQWILMLKQTVDSSDRHQVLELGNERSPVELGTFADIQFGHLATNHLSWTLAWDLGTELRIADPEKGQSAILFEDKRLTHSCTIAATGSGPPHVSHIKYNFDEQEFIYRRNEKGKGFELSTRGNRDFKFKRERGRAWELPPPIKCFGFPDQVASYYRNAGFLGDFQLEFERLFTRIFHLGPLREYPHRQYTWGGTQPSDMGRRGERAVDAILAARSREKISRGKGRPKWTLEEYIAHWLKELRLIDMFSVSPIAPGSNLYGVRVQCHADSTWVLLTEVSFGVSQVLPVLTLCYYVPEGATIILEQPEIHLHPSVQAGLADVFIDAIKTRNIQIIIESHSEHLLRRLQRRIAEEELGTGSTALYFCDMADDASRITPLEVDLYGNITNWPKDFFGDTLGEMAAISEAVLKRRQREAG